MNNKNGLVELKNVKQHTLRTNPFKIMLTLKIITFILLKFQHNTTKQSEF